MRAQRPSAAGVAVGRRLIASLLAIALAHTLVQVIAVQVVRAEPAEAAEVTVNSQAAAASAAKTEVSAPQATAPKVDEAPLKSPVVVSEVDKPAAAAAATPPESTERKGRAEPAATTGADSKKEPQQQQQEKAAEKKAAEASSAKPASTQSPAAKTNAKTSSTAAPRQAGTKSRLPANLGTVTSTGSGGPAHYMSKHDAYSAIAEKHGALAHDLAMRKSDKRHASSSSSHSSSSSGGLGHFGGIQKASGGFGDLLASPFKGVGDNGLARTLGASMRSIMKSKYSVPAYVASALLGAVALLAFYESPISPLPVPPLPEPPVGRFPPEMPVISPNAQVPFRPAMQGQQQQYGNQRVFQMGGALGQQQMNPQVLFPGQQQQAQQRQMGVASAGPNPAAGVQQLAANLVANLAGATKQQAAQRKSGSDSPFADARSLFGAAAAAPKAGGQGQPSQPKAGLLSFLGFGGAQAASSQASSPASSPTAPGSTGADASSPSGQLGAAGVAQAAGPLDGLTQSSGKPQSSSGPGLSNSHLVNKVKSYFSRAGNGQPLLASATSGAGSTGGSNPYDQYQRMSFVQALMKDTAFLPAFLTPSRKSSPKVGVAGNQQPPAAARMAAGEPSPMQVMNLAPAGKQQVSAPATNAAAAKTGGSYGFVRAADRIAHALLDTFTSGIAQRGVAAAMGVDQLSARRQPSSESSATGDSSASSSLASATTSLLSDLMANYNSQSSSSSSSESYQQQQPQQQPQQAEQSQASARSDSQDELQEQPKASAPSAAVSAAAASPASSASQASKPAANSQPEVAPQQHVRKTRSVGFEYPIEASNSQQQQQQQAQQPSKAAQINNVIDFVADNSVLFKFVMNQVGLSQAVPYVEYVEQILAPDHSHH